MPGVSFSNPVFLHLFSPVFPKNHSDAKTVGLILRGSHCLESSIKQFRIKDYITLLAFASLAGILFTLKKFENAKKSFLREGDKPKGHSRVRTEGYSVTCKASIVKSSWYGAPRVNFFISSMRSVIMESESESWARESTSLRRWIP